MINLPNGERLCPKALFDNLVEGIWVIDRDANTTYVNLCMAEMLGYRVGEMQGKHLFEFTDDRGIAAAKENLERRRQGRPCRPASARSCNSWPKAGPPSKSPPNFIPASVPSRRTAATSWRDWASSAWRN
jgi:hypothetical protein